MALHVKKTWCFFFFFLTQIQRSIYHTTPFPLPPKGLPPPPPGEGGNYKCTSWPSFIESSPPARKYLRQIKVFTMWQQVPCVLVSGDPVPQGAVCAPPADQDVRTCCHGHSAGCGSWLSAWSGLGTVLRFRGVYARSFCPLDGAGNAWQTCQWLPPWVVYQNSKFSPLGGPVIS